MDLKLPAQGGNGPASADGDLGRDLNLKKASPAVGYLQPETFLSPLPGSRLSLHENGAIFKKCLSVLHPTPFLVPKMSQAFSLPTSCLLTAWQLITQVVICTLMFWCSTRALYLPQAIPCLVTMAQASF